MSPLTPRGDDLAAALATPENALCNAVSSYLGLGAHVIGVDPPFTLGTPPRSTHPTVMGAALSISPRFIADGRVTSAKQPNTPSR